LNGKYSNATYIYKNLTRVKKKQIFNRNPKTPDKTEKKTDLGKNPSSGNADHWW